MAKANRSVEQIERELDETAQRLAGDIDELVTRLQPSRLARAGVSDARRLLGSNLGPRPEVIGAIAGAVIVGVVLWRLNRR